MRPLIPLSLGAVLLVACAATPPPAPSVPPVPSAPSVPAAPVAPATPHAPAPASEPTAPDPMASNQPVEIFPHVRVSVPSRLVEFDAEVPAYAYVSEKGVVFLEVLVCTPQTREHEALLLTHARAADVHAALLMIGLRPGAPGAWKWEEKTLIPIPPTGDRVDVRVAVASGTPLVERPIGDWVYNTSDGTALSASASGFLFSGSAFVQRAGREWYAADADGTLVGLTTFGSETVAWARVVSPESSVDEPVWAVKTGAQPPAGTPVLVRLRPSVAP